MATFALFRGCYRLLTGPPALLAAYYGSEAGMYISVE